MKYLLILILIFTIFSTVDSAYIVKEFYAPPTCLSPLGITIDDTGDYMWISDIHGTIYKVSLDDENLGEEIEQFVPDPPVTSIGGMVYDSENNDLIVVKAREPASSAMYTIELDEGPNQYDSTLRFDITFGWPNGSAWDDIEPGIWIVRADYVYRELYLVHKDTGEVLEGPISVDTKYPNGLAYDGTYLYNLGNYDGYILRYDRMTGERADGDGFPLPPLFELNEGELYSGNLVMNDVGEFWQSCEANRKIYLINFISNNIETVSIGMIKCLVR